MTAHKRAPDSADMLKELEIALREVGGDMSEERKWRDQETELKFSDVGSVEAWFWEDAVSYHKAPEYSGPGRLGDGNFGWLLALKDGGWGILTGWHDFTGWGCKASLTLSQWPSKLEAIRMGMTTAERDAFGLWLEGEK